MRIFMAYRDAPERRRALAAALGAPERYRLYGLDDLAARGHEASHNLTRAVAPRWARTSGAAAKALLERAGGYGGDFGTVLGSIPEANRADVVLSTVDTVGIPLMLLRRLGVLRRPLVYTAIGLPERLAQLASERIRTQYAAALAGCAGIVAYSSREAGDIRAWLDARGEQASVSFIPFGVDTDALRPGESETRDDVVSVGADPHRDFELLLAVARERPGLAFRIVTTTEVANGLPGRTPNVAVEADLSFEAMLDRLQGARAVALPVRENTYSGATTVLLQAMALAKPVVVSRTSAIASGYGLVDGENCRLVVPGEAAAFGRALDHVLGDELVSRALGSRARRTVETQLTWSGYVGRMEGILLEARRPGSSY